MRSGLRGIAKKAAKAVLPASAIARVRLRTLRPDLPALAEYFGTDKWGLHWYASHYQDHLGHLKRRNFNLLEIGVGGHENPIDGGRSLRMWKAYFPKAKIYGIDIFDKSALEESRIRIFRGSQADPDFLFWVARQIGPIDVVIDDGSHVNEHVRASFQLLFPLMPEGGIYVIEDLSSSYWPEFGGNEDPNVSDTSMGMLKCLVDGLNWEEFRGRKPGPLDRHIVAIHLYHNLAFIHKGRNEEGSNKDQHHRVHL